MTHAEKVTSTLIREVYRRRPLIMEYFANIECVDEIMGGNLILRIVDNYPAAVESLTRPANFQFIKDTVQEIDPELDVKILLPVNYDPTRTC